MNSCHPPVGQFKLFRAIFLFCWHLFCFDILLLMPITMTNKAAWCVGKASMHYPYGPRFESQVLHFLNNFVFQVFPCVLKLAAYHAPSSIQMPDGQEPDLVVNSWRSTIVQVNACILDPRKSKRPA